MYSRRGKCSSGRGLPDGAAMAVYHSNRKDTAEKLKDKQRQEPTEEEVAEQTPVENKKQQQAPILEDL
jgi:hypothetical protein